MLLLLVGCVWGPATEKECTSLRLTTGRPECDGISLCIETKLHQPWSGPVRTTSRSWFQDARGRTIEAVPPPRCADCPEPSLRDRVCATPPQQAASR